MYHLFYSDNLKLNTAIIDGLKIFALKFCFLLVSLLFISLMLFTEPNSINSSLNNNFVVGLKYLRPFLVGSSIALPVRVMLLAFADAHGNFEQSLHPLKEKCLEFDEIIQQEIQEKEKIKGSWRSLITFFSISCLAHRYLNGLPLIDFSKFLQYWPWDENGEYRLWRVYTPLIMSITDYLDSSSNLRNFTKGVLKDRILEFEYAKTLEHLFFNEDVLKKVIYNDSTIWPSLGYLGVLTLLHLVKTNQELLLIIGVLISTYDITNPKTHSNLTMVKHHLQEIDENNNQIRFIIQKSLME